MADHAKPKRRFAPVPVETTFQSNRRPKTSNEPPSQPQPSQPTPARVGPHPELTPDPSPVSTTGPSLFPTEPRERRRFAPQLIETSRRSRRVGDPGPATRPTDKTDITPYTNHIYSTKPKTRRKHDGTSIDEPARWPPQPPTRRETEDETFKQYLLDLAAKEAERQIQETALAAFPNSRAREGGVAHFYFDEGSGSDGTAEAVAPVEQRDRKQARIRRESSGDVDMGWWQQHMQDHAKHLQEQRQQDEPDSDSRMDVDGDDLSDSEVDNMDLEAPPDPIWTTSRKVSREESSLLTAPQGSSKPFNDPFAGAFGRLAPPNAAPNTASTQNHTQGQSPFGRPFGAFGLRPDPKAEALRKAASPPMLGKDLVFRRCPSPKLTKLEPDHPFVRRNIDEKHRDLTGHGGLWRGFCFKDVEQSQQAGPRYMETPLVPGTPGEPLSQEDSTSISEEPDSIFTDTTEASETTSLWTSTTTSKHRDKNASAKGLHMLHGVDDRLKREKVKAEKDEKIAQEFDDEFVTLVYNYLSLGYPAMARGYDEELSKISRMSIEELEKDDQTQMAKGHMLQMNLGETPEEERCPRWKALRTYITEWARQHPDLDNLDPLAWGVRERRGSWAI